MTIIANRPSAAKAPKGKAAKAARKAEEASWWTQPIPAQLSLGDAGKVDDRRPRLVALPDGARANLWPTNVQLGQTLAELFEAGQADRLPEIARACGVSIDDALTALRDHLVRTGMLPADSPIGLRPVSVVETRVGACANEPTWCERDHDGEETSVDGFVIAALHERRVAQLVAIDPQVIDGTTATAGVYIESCDDSKGQPAADSPPRVVLALGDETYGDSFPIHGQVGTQAWTAPVEQVRALAGALLVSTALIEGAKVTGPCETVAWCAGSSCNGPTVDPADPLHKSDLASVEGIDGNNVSTTIDLDAYLIQDNDGARTHVALGAENVELSLDDAEKFALSILAGVYAGRQAAK